MEAKAKASEEVQAEIDLAVELGENAEEDRAEVEAEQESEQKAGLDVSLSDLVAFVETTAGSVAHVPRRARPRWEPELPVAEYLVGFVAEEPDHMQEAGVPYMQSSEIQRLSQDFTRRGDRRLPISKKERSKYGWCALQRVNPFSAHHQLYTTDPDSMQEIPKFEGKGQNCCDICGKDCA